MLIKQAFLLFYETLYIEDSSSLIRILNFKYIILPSFIRSIAILKDVTAIAISLYNLIFASNILYRNVFSVLPDLFIKKYLDT